MTLRTIQITPGKNETYKPRRSEKRTVKVDRYWDVYGGDEVIGQIRYVMLTRSREPRGARYVTARWESPGWQYRTLRGEWNRYERWNSWLEVQSKAEALRRIEWENNRGR